MPVCTECRHYAIPHNKAPCVGCVWTKDKPNFEPKEQHMKDEKDPNGKSAHESGSKLDAGKNRLSLVFFGFVKALKLVGQVGTFGANKYTPNGWVEVPNATERYMDAALRHLFAFGDGEWKDPDSGLPHLAHAAWNVLAVLQLHLKSTHKEETHA